MSGLVQMRFTFSERICDALPSVADVRPIGYFRVIPPAIDVDAFAGLASPFPGEVGTASRPIRLVSVARLEWKKDAHADAVARLVRRGIHVELRIVGSGVYEQAIRFARKQLNLENQVTLVGAIPARREFASNSRGQTCSCTRRYRRGTATQ